MTAGDFFTFVGTFTSEFKTISGSPMGEPATGISIFRLDGATGSMSPIDVLGGLISPSFLVANPRLPVLYAVERQWSANDLHCGALTTMRVEPASGRIAIVRRTPTGGMWPCFVSTHPSGNCLYIANITSSNFSICPVFRDGTPGSAMTIQHDRAGGTHARGPGARTHSVTVNPSGTAVLVCDMGTSRLTTYGVLKSNGLLSSEGRASLSLPAGTGPRHAAYHPKQPYVYVLNEISSAVSVFAIGRSGIELRLLQEISTLPPAFSGESRASEIVVHPEGRYVYASNRGHDSIAVFLIDASTGELSSLGHELSIGDCPRSFAITPDCKYMLVGNQSSGGIGSFAINPVTGRLKATGHKARTPTPVSIVFRAAPSRTRR